MAERYNGWTNHETCCVNLWLGNDDSIYWHRYWTAAARSAWDAAEPEPALNRSESARYVLSKQLEEEIGEGSPITEASLYNDLLQSALQNVDWPEVANACLVGSDCEGYETMPETEVR